MNASIPVVLAGNSATEGLENLGDFLAVRIDRQLKERGVAHRFERPSDVAGLRRLLQRGLRARVARMAAVSYTQVQEVILGHRNSPRVTRALAIEVCRVERKILAAGSRYDDAVLRAAEEQLNRYEKELAGGEL